ncbi:MAG: branched-chain amino acid ABC transporter permease [Ilumatobacter sp.]|uniref:branched-chain amino acid ABC transporter permease n=1 Tax=Ilumatobacter sp. TaxID=1967498 RepID=UPI0026101D26|nr:branched-chain amino acid ABC transporter permease [Ilumatobacter sp.]MDJ0771297.1 branched-chain amino acid ABC transporter permease [Ilumatobacter sp.]
MRRGRARWLYALLVMVGVALLPSPAAAQDDAPSFSGQLLFEGEPVEGVDVVVADVDGSFSATATSDADGNWRVEVPSKRATYDVTLVVETLPEGVELAADSAASLQIAVTRPGQERRATFTLGERVSTGTPLVEQIAQATINGIKLGLILAMCSVGLSLIFGTTGLINFAHGELVSFGAVVAFYLNTESLELTLILAGIIGVVAAGALGAGMELGLMQPLRRMKLGAFQFVVVTIGLSLVGRQLMQMWVGGEPESYREYQVQDPWDLGLFQLTPRDLTIMVICFVGLVAAGAALQLTKTGKATRAVADNPDLASASGIPVDGIILRVWVAGAALAGLGGVMFGLSEVVQFDAGFRLLLLIFAAVVLGGLGTAYGAMVGGLLIGLVTEVSTVWVQNELKFVWALLALVVALLIRPQGLLGIKERVG